MPFNDDLKGVCFSTKIIKTKKKIELVLFRSFCDFISQFFWLATEAKYG